MKNEWGASFQRLKLKIDSMSEETFTTATIDVDAVRFLAEHIKCESWMNNSPQAYDALSSFTLCLSFTISFLLLFSFLLKSVIVASLNIMWIIKSVTFILDNVSFLRYSPTTLFVLSLERKYIIRRRRRKNMKESCYNC